MIRCKRLLSVHPTLGALAATYHASSSWPSPAPIRSMEQESEVEAGCMTTLQHEAFRKFIAESLGSAAIGFTHVAERYGQRYKSSTGFCTRVETA